MNCIDYWRWVRAMIAELSREILQEFMATGFYGYLEINISRAKGCFSAHN
ncbi:MAG: hypothetical protein OXF60_08525 [Gammaproteobacteria bacterium]|nr:hypothetical protein [Gammaproteobacteria bacterium]MCY4217827.1 hypothetical protein [Gammaproteobacteria bacterium]